MDLFKGSFTLNRNYILRKSYLGYFLFNINKAASCQINLYCYHVLRMFLHNCTNLTEIGNYFDSNKIKGSIHSVQELLNSRSELADLFVESDIPLEKDDVYKKISFNNSLIYDYTPESVDFLITNKCNLNCPHCYRNSKTNDKLSKIPLERVYKLIDEMERYRVQSMKITGGEPFLVPELYDIVKYATKKRIRLALLTNATLPLNEKWLNVLKSDNIGIGVSLDGSTSHTHDVIRGKGSFKKTVENLKKFSDCGISFSLTFSIGPANKHEISQVVEFAATKTNATSITFNFIEEIGRGSINESMFESVKIEEEELKKEIYHLQKKYEDTIKVDLSDNHGLAQDVYELNAIKEKRDLIVCSAGFSSISIDANMTVYPCIYAIGGKTEYPTSSLLDSSLMEAWNNSKLGLFRGELKVSDLPTCSKCDHKEQCNLKYCRLRPLFEGRAITDNVSFCEKSISV